MRVPLAAAIGAMFGDGPNIVNSPAFWAPLETTIVPARGAGSGTFTRATIATGQDWEGHIFNALSGEARFKGVRRVRNYLAAGTEDPTGWTKTNVTAVLGATDPLGGAKAVTVTATAGGGALQALGGGFPAGNTGVGSIWIRRRTGVGSITIRNANNAGDTNIAASVTTDWKRFSLGAVAVAGAAIMCVYVALGTNGDAVDVAFPQGEDVTGQSNQNPSEYVSVGVLASPYHGANVDGVKYFKTLNGNTVASNVVTEATGAAIPAGGSALATLSGTGAGTGTNNFSAPTFPSPTNLDIRVYDVAKRVWAGPAEEYFVSKWNGTGNQRSFIFGIAAAGQLRAYISTNGTDFPAVTSSVALTTISTNGVALSLRMTRVASSGVTTFYYSFDRGATWIQLGTTVVLSAGNAPFDSTASLMLGSIDAGATNPWTGTFTEAAIHSTIDGSVYKNFKASDWVAGANFTSSTTGEVYTLNGGARVLKYPIRRHTNESTRTNLVLQSENFGTTWAAVGTPTRVAAALRCGSVVLDLIGDDDAGVLEGYVQPITFTGDAVKALSIFFAQGTSTSSVYRLNDNTAGAERMRGVITWTNGIPTVTAAVGTLLGVDSLSNGVFRARLLTTSVTAANLNQLQVYPAAVTGSDPAPTGTAYFGGVQAENNAIGCTSYIPTTTATVQRNGDNLVLGPIAGNSDTAQGTAFARVYMIDVQGGNPRALCDSVSAFGPFVLGSTSNVVFNPGIYDGTVFVTHATGVNVDVEAKMASCWGGATYKVTHDGLAIGAGAGAFDGALWGAGANMNVASLDGDIGDIKLWGVKFDDALLVTASAT